MFNLGAPEMIFILLLALLIFGPKRLPQLGRTLGKAMGEFRRATTELQRSINLDIEEVDRERERQRSVAASTAAAKRQEEPPAAPDEDAEETPPEADPLTVPRSSTRPEANSGSATPDEGAEPGAETDARAEGGPPSSREPSSVS